MLKHLSQRISRKRLNSKASGSYQDLVALRSLPSTSEGFAHRSAGWVSPVNADAAPKDVSVSAAGFHALDPQSDQHVLQANGKHIFAAVFTQAKSTRGGLYLRQHLYSELLSQLTKQKGDVSVALQAAVDVLDADYRSLNPASHHILQGLEMAVAFLDFKSSLLYIWSNGSCRCVVGKALRNGQAVKAVADVGRSGPKNAGNTSALSEVFTVTVSQSSVDTIIFGSAGYWQEVKAERALLRAERFHQIAPKANSSSAAAHLINYGLHCVTDRLKDSADLRMSSLKSVNNLVSLQTGDKSQYKWGSRQPVRRRRGDVHRDMTVLTAHLHWAGRQGSFEGDSKKTRQALSQPAQAALQRHSHWDLVRLHFRDFPSKLRQMEQLAMPARQPQEILTNKAFEQ